MTSEPKQTKGRGSEAAPSFEEALQQLEELIERIEGGEIGLEKSIAEYERGIGLVKRCREVLERAELRVEELGKDQPRKAERAAGDRGTPGGPASLEKHGNGESDDADAPF